jgi:hypothetical protein
MKKIKRILLKFLFTREVYFFILQKKVYKKLIDINIRKMLEGKQKLTDKKISGLIVSLTSFPERISEIKYVIYSLLNQSLLPEKIVLWLAESQFLNKEKDLPKELLNFKELGLEIHWCEDIKPYKKLIPSLLNFPDYYILTADDDIYYRRKWIQKIWHEHDIHPNDVVCHIAKKIKFDKNSDIIPYMQWQRNIKPCDSSFIYFPLCGGGALFHKTLVSNEIVNKELFLKLSPYADDIWFYIMAVKNNVRIRVVRNPYNQIKYVNPYRDYKLIDQYTLTSQNVDNNQNDIQFKKIIEYYKIDLVFLRDN